MRLKQNICSILVFVFAGLPSCLAAQDVQGAGADLVGTQAPSKTPAAKLADDVKPGQEPAKPVEQGNAGKPPEETPSGTKPAEPATPGEDPAIPAEPDKGREEKDKKDRKDKPGKGGKSGGLSQPAAALLPAAGATFGLLPVVGKEKKEAPEPELKDTAVSSEPVKTAAAADEPLYSAGKGPRIAVLSFDGEAGAEFAALLAKVLSPGLQVYSPRALAARNYSGTAVTRLLAKKICAETGVDYLVTGRVSKKTGTLTIISVFLRDGKTGDTVLTDYQNLKPSGELARCSEAASVKILERLAALD